MESWGISMEKIHCLVTDNAANMLFKVLRCMVAALDSKKHSDVCRGGLPSARPPSPAPSVSLLEIKAETRLVLGAFLRHTLSVPLDQRPGRIGGAYRDPNKVRPPPPSSTSPNVDRCRVEDDGDSLDSQTCSEGEKKHKFKDLIKKHLKSRSSKSRLQKDSQKTDSRLQEDVVSPYSSTSEEGTGDEVGKKKKKKKKKKSPFSSIIQRIKLSKKKNNDVSNPSRPTSPVTSDLSGDPIESVSSPGHPPEFYAGVAETIDRFAQKHSVKRRDRFPARSDNDKEAVVQQLVQVLQMQGDAINNRIQSSPSLQSFVANISYSSFTKLVDKFASQSEPPAPAPASPTLSRIAMTMEVSRRVITATGTQRIQGYAERYMENFTPWVKSRGGWENILQLEDVLEYD
ncbi:hypothetical protein SKAU_G00287360 [Synaphobranchus kaupii]|uniref:Bcl-2-like protein 12 n=1 Tax=Synaphobranchus kaupii TaxID=118154 RepID=A0A9Q1IPJ7_SYNKA|nr:hypothetical protein SKAU_G00287360 [Synaphobranchus kaupii]